MDPMDIDDDGIEILQFQIDVDERGEASASMLMQTISEKSILINDLKQELREEKIKYNNLVDAVFEKVLTKKPTTPEQEAIIRIFNPKGLFTKHKN